MSINTLGELVDELRDGNIRRFDTLQMEKDGVFCHAKYFRFVRHLKIHFFYNDINMLITYSNGPNFLYDIPSGDPEISILKHEGMGKFKELLPSCQLSSVREVPFSVFTDPRVKSANKK